MSLAGIGYCVKNAAKRNINSQVLAFNDKLGKNNTIGVIISNDKNYDPHD
jgi:hypothetical protein